MRETEGVSRIGLLCGNDTAAWPLRTAVAAGKCNCTDNAIPVDDRTPHVEIESPVRERSGRGERRVHLWHRVLKRRMVLLVNIFDRAGVSEDRALSGALLSLFEECESVPRER